MFRTISGAQITQVAPTGILASFFGAIAVTWLLATLVNRVVLNRPAADAPAVAICASFGNTVMLGLPIGLAAFGNDAAGPIAIILALHMPIIFSTAMLHAKLVGTPAQARSLSASALALIKDLTRQPIIMAILAATIWRISEFTLPSPVATMLDMLAKAGTPAALISLGLSLGGFTGRGQTGTVAVLLTLKLLITPMIAALLAGPVFHLPPLSAHVVILMAALPPGASAFLFASREECDLATAVSRAVATGTALSALTLTALMSWI
jgi:malonate transporter and related proteins